MSSVPKASLPKEIHLRRFFFFFFDELFLTIFTNVQISSRYWSVGGSAGQPPQDQDEKALNQPKPSPSGKTA